MFNMLLDRLCDRLTLPSARTDEQRHECSPGADLSQAIHERGHCSDPAVVFQSMERVVRRGYFVVRLAIFHFMLQLITF